MNKFYFWVDQCTVMSNHLSINNTNFDQIKWKHQSLWKKEWLYLDSITIRIKIKRLYIHDKKYIYEEIKEFFSSLLLGAIWNKSSCHHQLLRRAIRLPRHPLPPTRPTARWKMPMGLIPAVQFAKKHTQYPKFLAVFILFVNPVSRNFKKLQTKSAVLSAIKTHS